MYEESLRTPFIIRWPGVVKPGTVNKTDIISNLDIAQTFLDIAGMEQPKDMQGRSFLPILKGNTPKDWRKSFYYHYYEFPAVHSVRRHCGVTTGRYKLIHFYRINEWELYDLEKDPTEINNVYGKEGMEDITKKLKAEILRLKKKYEVPTDEEVEKRWAKQNQKGKKKKKKK